MSDLTTLITDNKYNSELSTKLTETLKDVEKYRIEKEVEAAGNFDNYESKRFKRETILEVLKKIDPKFYLWTLAFILAIFNSKNFWAFMMLKLNMMGK